MENPVDREPKTARFRHSCRDAQDCRDVKFRLRTGGCIDWEPCQVVAYVEDNQVDNCKHLRQGQVKILKDLVKNGNDLIWWPKVDNHGCLPYNEK